MLAVTHDQTFANPALKAKTPFVKPPVHIDYGIRLYVGGSTFINRGCMIMDTPVADVVIGEGCNIGPNCTIIGVTRKSSCQTVSRRAAQPLAGSGAVPVQPSHAAGLHRTRPCKACRTCGKGTRLNGKTDPVRLDERLQRQSIGQPVTIGNDVWIGANVTIL